MNNTTHEKHFKYTAWGAAVVVAALVLSFSGAANAWPPGGKGGGKGGGGGGAAYTIIDLSAPESKESSAARKISNVNAFGTTFVLGYYGINSQPCVWTVDADDTVVATGLEGLIDDGNDVNSAGVIVGRQNNRPLVLLSDGTSVFPADASITGNLYGINDPDSSGIFQVVGILDLPDQDGIVRSVGTVWHVDVAGNVLFVDDLTDAQNQNLIPYDISNSLFVGASLVSVSTPSPAIGVLDDEGALLIDLLPTPPGIDGVFRYQVDDAGNLLGFGYELSSTGFGYYARAVIWPADGSVIDLTAQTGVADTEGNGIALVDGTMHVVGRGHNNTGDAFAYLYADGSITDLNRVSRGDRSWILQFGEGVNTAGMICGRGRVGAKHGNFDFHGFVLIPNGP